MSKLTKKEAIARLPGSVKSRIDVKSFEYAGWNKPSRVRCLKHDRVVYPTFASLVKGALNCPDCRVDRNRERGKRMVKNSSDVQKNLSTALASWKPRTESEHYEEH